VHQTVQAVAATAADCVGRRIMKGFRAHRSMRSMRLKRRAAHT
jgi:hypothetical protein